MCGQKSHNSMILPLGDKGPQKQSMASPPSGSIRTLALLSPTKKIEMKNDKTMETFWPETLDYFFHDRKELWRSTCPVGCFAYVPLYKIIPPKEKKRQVDMSCAREGEKTAAQKETTICSSERESRSGKTIYCSHNRHFGRRMTSHTTQDNVMACAALTQYKSPPFTLLPNIITFP